jgi:hypothetical protein
MGVEVAFARLADPGVIGAFDPVIAIELDGPADDLANVLGGGRKG